MEAFKEQLAPMEARVFRLLEAGVKYDEITTLLGITHNNLSQVVWRIRKKEKALAARTVDLTKTPQAGDV